jgi:general L-amino acid transport system substrate-binding protein
VPGFGVATEGGEYEGFDIDFCRVVAAAVLGDANAVEFMPLTAEQRFTALQSGEIDVLIRNTTFTASRDGAEGARFLHTTYYDGQGMMVKADSEFQNSRTWAEPPICVLSGTTTELNLETTFQSQNIQYTPLPLRGERPASAGLHPGPLRRVDVRHLAACGVRSSWPENQGRSRGAADHGGDHVQGAARAGRP